MRDKCLATTESKTTRQKAFEKDRIICVDTNSNHNNDDGNVIECVF